MIGIAAIASYVSSGFLDNADRKEDFGISDSFIEDKLGILRVSRKARAEETSDMCVQAFRALQAKTGIATDDIDCVVVVTQNPDGHGIPHSSAIVHGKLDLPANCASFDISLGCSGFVYGLSIVPAFMAANGLRRGLLFTCDPYSKIIDPDDKDTVLLFGDAAAATFLCAKEDGGHWQASRFRFMSNGRDGGALIHANGRLNMNGRAVFNFSATAIPDQVKDLLAEAGLDSAEIDLFLFHQGSKYILDTLRKRLQLPAEKVPLKLREQGNTVSSSLPLLLEDALSDVKLSRMLLCGFGVGLSAASCLLERRPSP